MQENLDLDRYPLDKPGTPAWDAMVAKAKAELAETGMFNLPGFLKPAAQRAAVGELAPRFAGESFTHARKHNVYFRKEVLGLAADHPALTLFETINKTLCGDQISGSIKALYEWPPFAAFLAAHPGSAQAQAVVDEHVREIELYERYRAYFSYGFYIARKLPQA